MKNSGKYFVKKGNSTTEYDLNNYKKTISILFQ